MSVSTKLLPFCLSYFLCSIDLHGQAKLSYHYEEETFEVSGFDLSRPYSLVGKEKTFLPIDGRWGLEIESPSFWDFVYYPHTYKLKVVPRTQVHARSAREYSIEFSGYPLPVFGKDDPPALSWKASDFKNAVILLGWHFEGATVAAEVIRANEVVDSDYLDEIFAKFRVQEYALDGFPFICIFSQVDLRLREPMKAFESKNPDYLYRLACRGYPDDFEELGVSARSLSKVLVQGRLTLMHGAALYGNLDVLRYLRSKRGYKIREESDYPVVRHAIYGSRVQAVEYLIKQGYDPLIESRLNYNPFIAAVLMGSLQIVNHLTEDGLYLSVQGWKGYNAYKVAARMADGEMYDMLADKAEKHGLEIKFRDLLSKHRTVDENLFNNCRAGNLNVVKKLLETGIDISEVHGRYDPFHAAVLSGNVELVRFLADRGANLEGRYTELRQSSLHLASKLGYGEMIGVLVDAGIDINLRDSAGSTPLYTAVLSKQVDSVHELLRLGANPNLRPPKRPPAVWMAVIQDERESIQSLIDYGAECELNETLAMRLMDYALAFDIPEVVTISLEQCLTPDFTFRGAVPGIWVADYYGSRLSKQVLIKQGADPDAKPRWIFKKTDEAFHQLIGLENFSVVYPKNLREKYGDLEVHVEVIVDPVGKIRFPKFHEPLPWDLKLFIRESIRSWVMEVPHNDELLTAYRVKMPIQLTSSDYGVKVYEVSDLDKPPIAIRKVAPFYPSYLKRLRIQGVVNVVFIVDEEGNVRTPRIERSSHRDFNAAALNAVGKWKFKPGFKDGKPVWSYVRLPLEFTLRN